MVFRYLESLYATDLSDVWGSLPLEDKTALSITVGNKVIPPQTQFETFFRGRRIKVDTVEDAEVYFFSIYDENKWIINQIKKHSEIILGLSDFDNWSDVITNTNAFESVGTGGLTSAGKVLNNSGTTDNNSLVDPSVLNPYMSTGDDRLTIPANSMTQVNTTDEREDNTTSLINNKSKSTTVTGNNSSDFIGFHNIKLRSLKNEFWAKFNCLFI